jgi:O-antigen ligase
MSIAAPVILACYMTSLAACLTVYGRNLMNVRWLTLVAFFITGCLFWASSLREKRSHWEKNGDTIIVIYLLATFMSVIAAENPLFSGFKWASHALMIFTLLVLARNGLAISHAAGLLLFLKALVTVLLLVSWLKPLPSEVYRTSELFRGAFGNSNAMGQVAAIGTALYLHGLLTDRSRWLRISQIGMICLASWIMWSSGSRSALIAFLISLGLIHYFYRKLLRGKVLWVILLATTITMVFPGVLGKAQKLVLRSGDTPVQNTSEQLLMTRKSVWTNTWAGFQKRPVFGWGFGADDSISPHWEIQLKSLGTVQRDAVNDSLVALESTGVVGLGAYMMLVIFALRQMPTRRERRMLSRIQSMPLRLRGVDFSHYHLHAITFTLSASLLLMVQFDNTALSAGNFISTTIWFFVVLSGVARRKARIDQELYQRHKQLAGRRPPERPSNRWARSEPARW